MNRIFSGVQPTGNLHLGNYLGAIKNWVKMQDDFECIYCIVDLHAITVAQDPAELTANTREVTAGLIASGIDPERSIIFNQSRISAHAELAWILNCHTPLGWLNRMTQFKEKAGKKRENAVLGLYAYPVLMAADILLHRVHVVPVGDDQTQHLEFTRDLVDRFNSRFGDHFPLPEQVTPGVGARVMSLKDPTSKMSKSDPDVKSRILVIDEPDVIHKKIRTAVTDSGSGIEYDIEKKAGISNLLDILSVFTERPVQELVDEYAGAQYGTFKDVVADAIIEGLSPLRQGYKELDDREVERLMTMGALEARTRGEQTMTQIRKAVGLNA